LWKALEAAPTEAIWYDPVCQLVSLGLTELVAVAVSHWNALGSCRIANYVTSVWRFMTGNATLNSGLGILIAIATDFTE
jgi:hypothetical protein